MKCGECGGEVVSGIEEIEQECRGVDVTLKIPCNRCSRCGDVILLKTPPEIRRMTLEYLEEKP